MPKLSYNSLSYGSECWQMAELNLKHMSTFHTKNLQNILRILSPKRTYQNKPTNALIPDNIFGR